MQYTLDWVREQVARLKQEEAGNIRVHPNGFIQVDLAEVEAGWHQSHKQGHSGANLRLHIWNPPDHRLPRQGTVNEVHDHVFDMKSTVIKGDLTQRLYGLIVGIEPRLWTHDLYRAVYNKSADSRLEHTGISGKLEQGDEWVIGAGEVYTQSAHTLHDSDPLDNCVVTVMEKELVHPGDAFVVVPLNTEPDNSFDRANAAPADYLWSAVEAAIA